MRDLWRIIVLVVEQMLQINEVLIEHPKNITIIVSDGVRQRKFEWRS